MFHTTRLERLASNKHSNLLGLFVSYENRMPWLVYKLDDGVMALHRWRFELTLISNGEASYVNITLDGYTYPG